MLKIVFAAIIIVVVIILSIVVSCIESKRCPECKKLGLELENKVEIDRYDTTKKVEDVDKDKNGKVIRTIEKTLPVTMVVYEEYYKCKYCGKTFKHTTKEEL